MGLYARIVGGVVAEVISTMIDGIDHDIGDMYHADIVASLVSIDNVSPAPAASWTYDGHVFAPPVVAPAPAAVPTYTFLEFIALFTSAEQTAIVGSTDTQVKLFLLMAAGATFISLADPKTTNGIAYLVSISLLTQARATAILAGSSPAR